MESLIFVAVFMLMFVVVRPFTVTIHELGHAIPARILTRQPVTIYLGSYGDTTKSRKVKIGKLTVWLAPKPFLWQRGLCAPDAKTVSIKKQFIYTLTGPLASLTCSVISLILMFNEYLPPALVLVMMIFTGSFWFDFYTNIKANPTPIKLDNGNIVYNDGTQLRKFIRLFRMPKGYAHALNLCQNGFYKEASALLEKLIAEKNKQPELFQVAIYCYHQLKDDAKAIAVYLNYKMAASPENSEVINIAASYSRMGDYSKALELIDGVLQQDPLNTYALNNKGYILNLDGRYAEAIPFFDRAIALEPESAYAYNNRGLAKLKQGFAAQGLADIERSLRLDPENGYAYRNLGIYHFDKTEYKRALELFQKSKSLDPDTHLVNEWISATEKQLG